MLQKQSVEINAANGLAEGTDPRVLPQGQGWIEASNVVVSQAGAFEKRLGYEALPFAAWPTTGEPLPNTSQDHEVRALRGALHCYADDGDNEPSWWAYTPDTAGWSKRGPSVALSYTLTPKISMATGVTSCAVVQCSNGTRVYGWTVLNETWVNGLSLAHYRVESSDGAALVEETVYASGTVGGSPDGVGITACGDEAVLLFRDQYPGQLTSRVYDATIGLLGAPVLLAAQAQRFAVCRWNATHYVLAWSEPTGGGEDLEVRILEPDGTVLHSYTLPIVGDAVVGLSVGATAGAGVCVGYTTIATGAHALLLSPTLALVADTVVDATIAIGYAMGAHMDSGGNAYVNWVQSGSTGFRAMSASLDGAGAIQWTAASWNAVWDSNIFEVRGVPYACIVTDGLAEGAFTQSIVALDGRPPYLSTAGGLHTCTLHAVVTAYASNAWATAFLAGQATPNVDMTGTTSALFAVAMAEAGYLDQNTVFGVSASLCEMNFEGRQPWNRVPAQQRDCYALSGGIAAWNDGQNEVELGYVGRPKITASNAGAGTIPAGTYVYATTYEWIDTRGNVHTSQPAYSSPITLAVNSDVDLELRTVGVTRKAQGTPTPAEGVTIAVFRTESLGGIFYRITPPRTAIGDVIFNDPVNDEVATYTDTLTDLQLTALGYGTLYTDGGRLPARPVAGFRHAVTHRQRLWGIDASDARRLLYSQNIAAQEGPLFHEQLSLRLDDSIGEATALASVDDKLIVFTSEQIFWVSGDGPNDNGQGGAFNGPFPVAVDCGCVDPRSVVVTPQGVYFQGPRGIMLLDRGLQLSFAGLPVQDKTQGAQITAATLDGDARRVSFLVEPETGNSFFVVLDYTYGLWTTSTLYAPGRFGGAAAPQSALSSCMWQGRHVVFGATSQRVMAQGSADGLDDGGYPTSVLSTPWVKLAGVNGYQRAWRVTATGEKLSNHAITLGVYADYNTTQQQSGTFQVGAGSQIIGLPVERLSLTIKPQRCSAIRVVLTDGPPTGAQSSEPRQGWSLAGVSFDIGVNAGATRLPARNKG